MSETAEQRPAQLRIVDDIRADIASGTLQPGDRLPSNRALIADYGVSTQTVQRAINILKTEGVVEARPGRGVFVREQPTLRDRTVPATDVDPHLRGHPVNITGWCRPAPDDIAALLGVRPDEPVIGQETLFVEDGKFVEILTSYYSPVVADPRLSVEKAVPAGGAVADLRRLGFAPDHGTEWVQTRMPTPNEARLLSLPPGVAILRVVRAIVDAGGRVLEVQVSVLAGDRYQLLYELPIHD